MATLSNSMRLGRRPDADGWPELSPKFIEIFWSRFRNLAKSNSALPRYLVETKYTWPRKSVSTEPRKHIVCEGYCGGAVNRGGADSERRSSFSAP